MSRNNTLNGGGGAGVTCAPGVTCPTVNSMPGQTTGQSAYINFQQAQQQKAALGAVGGSRTKRFRGGQNAAPVVIPQLAMPYPVIGTVSPNSTLKTGAIVSSQANANAQYDSLALTGGRHKKSHKKGGNPNWFWGCHSGGRKTRRRIKKQRSKRGNRKSRKR